MNLAWAYVRYSTPTGSKDGEKKVEGKVRPAIVLQSGAEVSTIFRCTSKDKSGKGFPTYALVDWKSYGLNKPTFVDLLYRYTISNSDIVRIASELTDRDMKGLLDALRSHAPKGEIDVSGKDNESVKSEGVQAGKEPLRPFYEFLYDYLDQGMGFVFEDRPDAFEDALRYYGFSGDLLQDKLDNADEGEIREFIVNHSVDTAPEDYEGNLENLKNAIDADEDPDSYAQGLSLLDKAFGKEQESLNEAVEPEPGDLQGIVKFLIEDENEAVDGYDKAIKAFNAATLPTPDREHIVSELQHIKEEELEHIRELEDLLQYVPGSYVPGEQAVIAADAEDEASKEEAEEGEEPSVPEGQGMGKEK